MRVVMLMGTEPWMESWARAASTHADVVRVSFRSRADGGKWLERVDGDAAESWPEAGTTERNRPSRGDAPHYSIRVPLAFGRYRMTGRYSDLPLARRFVRALREIERDQGPVDVVHAHFYTNARWLPLAHRWCTTPYVVTEHSTGWSGRNPDNQVTARGFAIARRTYEHAARVIPVSEDLQRNIEQRGITARFTVIPNPSDAEVFAPEPVAPRVDGPARLVTVSRLAPVKGHADLLTAVRTVEEGGRPVQLDIVGNGPSRPDIERRIAADGLADRVVLTGRLAPTEIAARLRSSDVYVMASHDENLPVSVIEALLTGIPVVATDVGGVRELVTEGMQLVPSHDPAAIAAALSRTLAALPDPETRVRRGELARTRYSYDAVGTRLAEVYSTLT